MKEQSVIKKRMKGGAFCRTPRDAQMAQEWAALEDTLSPEEEKLVREAVIPHMSRT
jgi:hypothetical protein